MRLFTAPEEVPEELESTSIFLAGSIEQGTASQWQQEVIAAVEGHPLHGTVTVFNPRRTQWDASWSQTDDNPEFVEQVNWELDQLWRSDITFFFFDPSTKSPITLMELGIVAGSGKRDDVIVVCPPGFWRRGNVQILCARNNIQVHDDLDAGLSELMYSIIDLSKYL
jgi:hypothetical protein